MTTTTETQNGIFTPIQLAAIRIVTRRPHLADMAAKAAEYAERENGVDCLTPTLVHVRNVEGTTYRLTYTSNDGWQCTCPAFKYNPAVINTHRYCKHIVALAILDRVNQQAETAAAEGAQ